MLLTSSWLIDISLVLLTAIFLLHKYLSRNYDYWKKRGIFYIKPKPFFGNLYNVISFKSSMGTWMEDLYNSTEKPYVGVFALHKPILVLRSPQLIRQVLMKDFNHFANRTLLAPEHNQVIAHLLFFAKYEDWKLMRSKMSPAFTSGKLKAMFPVIQEIALEMCQYIKNNQGQLDSKELASKFSTEVIGKTAFGVKAGCFEDENCEFRRIGRSFFDFRWINAFNQSAYIFMQGLASFFRLEFVEKASIDYLKNVIRENIKQRETTNIKGNDIMDIVVEMKKNKEFCEKYKFEGDKVLAPAFQFFAAGTETTSQAIAFTLYELCVNPHIQNKARNEILNNFKGIEDITYESLNDMKYLEMCIIETLRLFPVLPFLDRQCTSDWTIPGTDIVIDKKAAIYIPLPGLHTDEKYFSEPDKYNPERFVDRGIYNQNGLYFLPFGDGPRICIGERFAMINVKLALINILFRFEIRPTSATPIPLILTKSLLAQPLTGLNMRYVELQSTII